MKIIFSLLALVLILYLSSLNWRRSVKIALALVVLEGALRKWVLPQASEFIYFLKDFVLIGAYLSYFLGAKSERKYPLRNGIIPILIFLSGIWCTFQAFNPSLGSPIIGILGLKAYLLYIPMIWLLPNLFQSEEELYIFLRNHMLLIFPTGLLGIVQFFSSASSFLNVYAPGIDREIATFGYGASASVRVTGTFSFIKSYQAYLSVCFALLLPMLARKQSWHWRLITTFELILVSVNALMTGSRTPVIVDILVLSGYLISVALAQPARTFRMVQQFFLPLATAAAILPLAFSKAIEQFQKRLAASGTKDFNNRVMANFFEPLDFIGFKEIDGFGTGILQAGTPALQRLLELPPAETIPTKHEGEMGLIMLEIGPIGFVLWYFLRICIIFTLFRVFLKLKNSFLRQLALVACLLQLVQLPGHMVFNHTFAVYYWFTTGFIFLLPHLERVESWQEQQKFLTPPTNMQPNVEPAYLPGASYR